MAYISRHPEVIHLDEREKYDIRHTFSKARFVRNIAMI